jgi:hypothetical protein
MRRTFAIFLTLFLFLAACAPTPTATPAPTDASAPVATEAPKTPQALQPTPGSGALFVVVKPDGSEVSFTWDDLKKLPLANLTVEGKVEEGPKLIDVLTAAGVTEFTSVNLSGSSSPATLTRAQVDDKTILDFNNHGTVKLASTYIPKPQWTKDVAKIEVK